MGRRRRGRSWRISRGGCRRCFDVGMDVTGRCRVTASRLYVCDGSERRVKTAGLVLVARLWTLIRIHLA